MEEYVERAGVMKQEKSKSSILFAGQPYLRLLVNIQTAIVESRIEGHHNSEARLLESMHTHLKRYMTSDESELIRHKLAIAKSMLRNMSWYKSQGMGVAKPLGHAEELLTEIGYLMHEYAGDIFLKTSSEDDTDFKFDKLGKDMV